jgi:hypothetical protein
MLGGAFHLGGMPLRAGKEGTSGAGASKGASTSIHDMGIWIRSSSLISTKEKCAGRLGVLATFGVFDAWEVDALEPFPEAKGEELFLKPFACDVSLALGVRLAVFPAVFPNEAKKLPAGAFFFCFFFICVRSTVDVDMERKDFGWIISAGVIGGEPTLKVISAEDLRRRIVLLLGDGLRKASPVNWTLPLGGERRLDLFDRGCLAAASCNWYAWEALLEALLVLGRRGVSFQMSFERSVIMKGIGEGKTGVFDRENFWAIGRFNFGTGGTGSLEFADDFPFREDGLESRDFERDRKESLKPKERPRDGLSCVIAELDVELFGPGIGVVDREMAAWSRLLLRFTDRLLFLGLEVEFEVVSGDDP